MDTDRFGDFARNLAESIRQRVLRETNAAVERRRAAAGGDDDEPKRPRRERDDDDRDEVRRASERNAREDEAATAEPRPRQVEQTVGEDDTTDDGTTGGTSTGGGLNPIAQSTEADDEDGDALDVSDFTDGGPGVNIADTGTGVFAISDGVNDTSIASSNGVVAISRGDGDDPEFLDGDAPPADDGDDMNFVS